MEMTLQFMPANNQLIKAEPIDLSSVKHKKFPLLYTQMQSLNLNSLIQLLLNLLLIYSKLLSEINEENI